MHWDPELASIGGTARQRLGLPQSKTLSRRSTDRGEFRVPMHAQSKRRLPMNTSTLSGYRFACSRLTGDGFVFQAGIILGIDASQGIDGLHDDTAVGVVQERLQ